MASLGHVAVGLAAGRFHRGPRPGSARELAAAMLAFTALSLLPDLDVIAFALGIPYSHPFGHRGASHSLPVAAAVGTYGADLSRKRRKRERCRSLRR